MAVTLALCALVLAGAFVVLHTGGRADAVCRDAAFVPADGISVWPPGVRCSYGEPQTTDVVVSPWLWFVLMGVVIAVVALHTPHQRRATSK